MNLYLGIDLGKQGAVCFLDENGKIIKKMKTPLLKSRTSQGKKLGRDEYDLQGMAAIIDEAKHMGPVHAFVERAQPMPSALGGALANYQRGLSFGLWQGLLVGYRISYEAIRPQEWQKIMLAGICADDTKQASIIAAQRLWPGEDWRKSDRAKNADDGYTDSALLGVYGLRLRRGASRPAPV